MDFESLFTQFSDAAFLLAVSVTRIAMAFLLLPLFSNELIPALVRNSIFVALALVTLIVQPSIDVGSLSSLQLLTIFLKEAFIGIVLGVFFGVFLWAFESAGIVIDTHVGSSQGNIMDPLSGHDVTLIGEFIGRLANYLFMAAGGLLLLTGAVMESYALWPLQQMMPDLRLESVMLFEHEFASFFTLVLMLASPVMVVIFMIDMAMGMVNRFAQNFNVTFLSSSLKALAALIILVMTIPILMQVLFDEIDSHATEVQGYLDAVFIQPAR